MPNQCPNWNRVRLSPGGATATHEQAICSADCVPRTRIRQGDNNRDPKDHPIRTRPRPAVLAARESIEDALAHFRDNEPAEAAKAVRKAHRLIHAYIGKAA